MEFEIWPALLAGFSGVIAMMLFMRVVTAMGMTNMPPMPLVQGAMVTDDPDTATRIGMFTHAIVGGTVVFGVTYAVLFTAFGTASWTSGALIGVAHGLLMGAGLKPMGAMHPRMLPASAFSGDTAWRHDGQHLEIEDAGLFGVNYGSMTPTVFVLSHVVYGLVLGAVYNAAV